MTAPDLTTIYAAAQTYSYPAYRAAVSADIYIHMATGCDLDAATRRAFAAADKERRGERGCVSLDELLSEYGDALRVVLATPPAVGMRSERECRQRDYGGTGKREKGIAGLDEDGLGHLVSVLRNLVERNVVSVDPLTCAIDVRGLEPVIRRAVVGVISGATEDELARAGTTRKWVRLAGKWLRGYAPRLRTDLL